MKKLLALLLCLTLCLGGVAMLASCNLGGGDTTTAPVTTTEPDDETTTPEPDDETTTTAPDDGGENGGSDDGDDSIQTEDIHIATAEELMEFNRRVNEDKVWMDSITVYIDEDIDLTGYTWIPLDGSCFLDVTFDGQGHTISNLDFGTYTNPTGWPNYKKGCGFVGLAAGDLTFKDLTFKDSTVVAHDQSVGNFVGNVTAGAYITFENCKSIGFTADGWMDYSNTLPENGGHPIAFRLAGFIGHLMTGNAEFVECAVEDITLSGFHNLAAFVGYDGARALDAFSFTDCSVKNASFTFSYTQVDKYTVDQPQKFVSVFYNDKGFIDSVEACVDNGNTYEGVSYYDAMNDNFEYTPLDFRSWSEEDANPDFSLDEN